MKARKRRIKYWAYKSQIAQGLVIIIIMHGYHHNHGFLITIAGFFCAKTAAMVVPEIGEEMGAPAKGDIIPKA